MARSGQFLAWTHTKSSAFAHSGAAAEHPDTRKPSWRPHIKLGPAGYTPPWASVMQTRLVSGQDWGQTNQQPLVPIIAWRLDFVPI